MRNLGSEKSQLVSDWHSEQWLTPYHCTHSILLESFLRNTRGKLRRRHEERDWRGRRRGKMLTPCSDELCKQFVTSGLWAPECSCLVRYSWAFEGTLLHGNLDCFKGGSRNDPMGAALGYPGRDPSPTLLCASVVHLTFLLELVWKVIFVN